jgi:hydrogenase expression/formation protein HypC
MCFGIPMQIQSIDGFVARCAAKGVEREASLFMLQHEPPTVGDFVVVHLGYAVDRVSAEEAAAAWEIYDQLLAAEASSSAEVTPGLGSRDAGPLA